jgi:DNA-binding transcriptional LysR family regulator
MTQFDWDDVRLFLAAARAGSLTGAGRRLGLDAATVGRRIARLETALQATLLVRSVSGLVLTAAGSRLQASAGKAEAAMLATLEASRPAAAGGTVRISVSEGFGTAIIAPALPALRARRTRLQIELAANPGFLSPATRQVDIAVTLSPPGEGRLIVEPLSDYQLALYASPDYLKRTGEPKSMAALQGREIVGYVEDLIYAPELRYLDEIGLAGRPGLASTSIRAQREIILAGGGIGVLPCFLGDGLVRVCRREVLLTRRLWMSTHRDIAATARIRTLRDWLKRLVRAQAGVLAPF